MGMGRLDMWFLGEGRATAMISRFALWASLRPSA
jgi:hypothetical protein